jgi:putative restriction endonuclease
MARMPARVRWSPEELLVAFRLYCRMPFGRLHQRNPDIVELSRKLGRTPSAVAMKACNFASLDPVQRARDRKALENVSQADRQLWQRFQRNPEEVASEAEAAYAEVTGRDAPALEMGLESPEGPSEISRMVRTRRVQGFFRDAVLISYDNRCALSEIAVPDLLNASHIIPWKVAIERRADPRNGIALNVLYDRAFDRGLITFDTSLRVVLSRRLQTAHAPPLHRQALLSLDDEKCVSPKGLPPILTLWRIIGSTSSVIDSGRLQRNLRGLFIPRRRSRLCFCFLFFRPAHRYAPTIRASHAVAQRRNPTIADHAPTPILECRSRGHSFSFVFIRHDAGTVESTECFGSRPCIHALRSRVEDSDMSRKLLEVVVCHLPAVPLSCR